jgi:hypothetical protein
MFEEQDSHKGAIGFLPMFQHAVQASMVVEPTKRPFHLPPLATISLLMDILGWATPGNGDMILTIRHDGHNASLTQGAAVRLALVAFVQAQAVGFALALADANAVNRLQQFGDILAIGFTESEVERLAIGVNDQMAFQPFKPVFSRVPDFLVSPFFDFTTLASW